jgi:hypothetical protein
MKTGRYLSRRQLLAGLSILAVPALAGCTSSDDSETPAATENADDDSTDDQDSEIQNDSLTETPTGSNTEAETESNGANLDLQEANVVEVAFEETNGQYSFDVALHHDDDGEDGYANWWQVERLDETQLGRRKLLHAHSQQPFTRSETIEIPDEVDCVVVRGHDQTHGYGGQAMLVNLDSGGTRAVTQGADSQLFTESDCP